MLPDPVVMEHEGIVVVRDDLLPGGTKRRALVHLLRSDQEYVYASPAAGYAQVALAYACRDVGASCTVFTAKRKTLHPLTAEAKTHGAKIVLVPYGYLSHVQASVKHYSEMTSATVLPFGLDTAEMRREIARVACGLQVTPREIWTVAGSGALTRALQQAWPVARFYAVRIGREPMVGQATLYHAPERFEEQAHQSPPFPSSAWYDAKAWRFIQQYATPGALFWNVGA
jgi:hypothetical protein